MKLSSSVTITSSDTTEAESLDASITIFDGTTVGTFTIDAVDDTWPDGTQSVTFSVSGPGYTGDDESVTVTDDVSDSLTLVINEIDYDQPGTDASEFVEILFTLLSVCILFFNLHSIAHTQKNMFKTCTKQENTTRKILCILLVCLLYFESDTVIRGILSLEII